MDIIDREDIENTKESRELKSRMRECMRIADLLDAKDVDSEEFTQLVMSLIKDNQDYFFSWVSNTFETYRNELKDLPASLWANDIDEYEISL